MTNEVKNVPELRFPEFDDEWTEKKANEIFNAISDKNHNGDLEVLSASQTQGIIPRSLLEIDIKYNEKSLGNYKKTIPNDFIISLRSFQGGFEINNFTGLVSPAYTVLRFIANDNVSDFFKQYFKMSRFIKKLDSMIYGIRDGKSISFKEFSIFKINLPIKEEQQKIGVFFNKLDRQIELEEQKLSLLEEQKKGYMQKVFSQELRFKDENGNDYPEWVEETIPQIIQLITDYVANGSFAAIRENVTYSSVEDYAYVIRLQDASANWKGPFVYTNENAYDFLKKTSLFENDIIMSNVGTVGKFFKVPKMDKPMTLGPNALLFRSESNDMNFLYFYLNSKFFKKKLKRIITPGAQSKVNKTDLKKIAIKMPKLKEQEKIGDFFSRLDEIISKQSQKIGEMKLRKKGFLQKMFI